MPRATKAPSVAAPTLSGSSGPTPYTGTILDAFDLAGMIGPSWAAWRTFWKTVYALPFDDPDDLARFQRHTGRESPPESPVVEVWDLVGRRGGKSRTKGIAAGWLAIKQDYTQLLAPGERGVIPVIAADRKQARQIMNYLKGFVALEPIAKYLVREPLTASVEFTTGVTVEIATASYRTTRGYTNVGMFLDEVAFWRSDDSAEPDTEVLTALRGGMATIPDAPLFAGSTPYARKGEIYRAHQDYYGKNVPDLLVWNADTLSMHRTPRLEKFVAKEFERDPVAAASEYGMDGHVTFRSDVESFVDPEAVQQATTSGCQEIAPRDGEGKLVARFHAFTDPSGGSQDAWTLAIAYFDRDSNRAILAALRERRPPFSPAAVVSDYAGLLKLYGIGEIEGDHYAGEFPRELFRAHGVTYRPSPTPKSELYREWLPLLNAQRVALLDHPRLKAQFCGLERKTAWGGKDSVDHAPGGHDDLANATAGVLVRVAKKRPVQSVRFAL